MCANYSPPAVREMERSWSIIPPVFSFGEAFPGGVAPFLSSLDPRQWLPGCFGLMPHWAKPDLYRHTYNARSETVAEKPSFRAAWKQQQFCIIPAQSIYEPNYESGKAVRWRISRADGEPFGIAGIWERRMNDEGPARWSFSMLTINADEHPLMRRFHKPGEEKRMIVVIEPQDTAQWLGVRTEAEARAMLQPFDSDAFTSEAAPLVRRSV